MLKQGDIVVCTERYATNSTYVGTIGELTNIDNAYPKYKVNESYCSSVRLATIEEQYAYSHGCTNIADLHKYKPKELEYEIY